MNLRHPLLKLESSFCLPSFYPTASLAKSSSIYYCPGGVVSFAICCIFCHHHICIFNSFLQLSSPYNFLCERGERAFWEKVLLCSCLHFNGSEWVLGPWLTVPPFLFETLIFTCAEEELLRDGAFVLFCPFFPVCSTHSSKEM